MRIFIAPSSPAAYAQTATDLKTNPSRPAYSHDSRRRKQGAVREPSRQIGCNRRANCLKPKEFPEPSRVLTCGTARII
jgi:hypothetical protein